MFDLIENTKYLEGLVQDLLKDPPAYIAVDTEFVRIHTFFPSLSVIQIGFLDTVWIIDAIKCDINCLKNIFFNEKIIKVFHAARQDFEIIMAIFRKLPLPFFDLQIAAGFLNFGTQSSLETLSQHFLKKLMNKQNQFCAWDKRPLTADMLDYAYLDARTIFDLYPFLKNELIQKNRLDWILEEHQYLEKLVMNPIDLERVFFKMKHSLKSKKSILQLLELSLWREEKTRLYNKPKEKFLNHKSMESLIKALPLSKEKFKKILFNEKPYDFVAIKKEGRDQLFQFLTDLSLKKDFILNDLPLKHIKGEDFLKEQLLKVAEDLNLDAGYILKKEEIRKFLTDLLFIETLPLWKKELLKNLSTIPV
ncbi:MAG: Ribonuclease D [Holosporales bacterium]